MTVDRTRSCAPATPPLRHRRCPADTRLQHAQAERMAPLDLVAMLVSDELQRRQDRLFERRHKQAGFRDPDRALDSFDFDFNKKMNRALIFDLATAAFVGQREDALFSGHPARAKAISRRPSAAPPSIRATA